MSKSKGLRQVKAVDVFNFCYFEFSKITLEIRERCSHFLRAQLYLFRSVGKL